MRKKYTTSENNRDAQAENFQKTQIFNSIQPLEQALEQTSGQTPGQTLEQTLEHAAQIPENLRINEAPKPRHIPESVKKKKYRLEIISAILLLIFVALITWGQLNSFGSDPWIFFVLININAILMLVVLFLVARNIVRLLLERRRKIFGSRLRTRLVLAFFSISFIPILIMFLAANRILTTSVNYWFTGQVENSMQAALDVGHSFYNAASTRLQTQTQLFAQELASKPKTSWQSFLKQYKEDNQFTLLGIMQRHENTNSDFQSPTYTEQIGFANQNFLNIWESMRHSINFNKIQTTGFDSLQWPDINGDYIIIAMPVPHESDLYIIAGESIGKGLLTQLNKISKGFEEYTELKNLKQPLKLSFSLILGLLSLIVLFASIWLAFRLSREITEPILALAKGTKKLARGDWNIQVTDKGQDELGQLVNSFNFMTNEMHKSQDRLQKSQDRLQKMNWLIEENNLTLIERNQYIEAILEHITTGVATLDDKGTLITINKAVCDIFQIRAEQYEGLSFDMFLSETHRAVIQEMYTFLKENPEKTWIREIELLVQEKYSKILIQALLLPTFLRGGFGQDNKEHLAKNNAYLTGNIILVIEDITALSQEQRLSAWREVARRIAHEIKNPLTPIKLSTERLKRKFTAQIKDPVFRQCTDLIIQEVARMQNMVSDFSGFAALPTIHLELEDPMPILYNLMQLFKVSHPKILWELEEKTPVPKILLDKEALHRALFNILSNATDAIQAKQMDFVQEIPIQSENTGSNTQLNKEKKYTGVVDIICFTSLSYTSSAGTKAPQQFFIIEITDNGAGIETEEAARLFEPYFSKKATGTGLGLAIVRSIISDHAGTISAHKRENGTCIRISLPIYQSGKSNTE